MFEKEMKGLFTGSLATKKADDKSIKQVSEEISDQKTKGWAAIFEIKPFGCRKGRFNFLILKHLFPCRKRGILKCRKYIFDIFLRMAN